VDVLRLGSGPQHVQSRDRVHGGYGRNVDLSYLTAALARAGEPMPPWPASYTLHLN
jgi:hypothetical protein